MRGEARMRCSTTLSRLFAISAMLMASSASSQSEPNANAQNRIEQACIEANVVESMDTEARAVVSRVCRLNSVIATQWKARLARCERECALGLAALKWAKGQGFEECVVGWTRTTHYKDVLVFVDPEITDRRMWTQDVPFGLSRFTLPEGRYLCKWGMLGGPSTVIDTDGSEVDFFLIDWVKG